MFKYTWLVWKNTAFTLMYIYACACVAIYTKWCARFGTCLAAELGPIISLPLASYSPTIPVSRSSTYSQAPLL